MLLEIKDLIDKDVIAEDGKIGKSHDLIIDHVVWTVQYIVCSVGKRFRRKKILIPHTIIQKSKQRNEIEVSALRKDLLADDIIHVPHQLVKGKFVVIEGRRAASQPASLKVANTETGSEQPDMIRDPDLLTMKVLSRYRIETSDRVLNRIKNFVVNADTWIIQCILINTRAWPFRKNVLLPVPWITGINIQKARVTTDISSGVLRSAPRYDPSIHLSSSETDAFFKYFANLRANENISAKR
ncbi:MAG: hypothetical protein GTO51_00290 [Candidatus Latescibacteria bacterium]|nr:hypothetical protein [Candidatus Latescibacterota bacterium]NIM64420.1 hypothetical protein [Candidatus Latescibacterota bacterium]NIO00574.1 hypothetical protein [Candidatus Latescibacterota bacterium]NIO26974.1 hypothetical protein [Candidatus Latescibacterota bacterium]NIO56051.1 hypothetical protein [Candidatus Latescibacterota bacterium]